MHKAKKNTSMPFNVVSKCSFVFNGNDRMVPSLRLVTVIVYSKAIIISQKVKAPRKFTKRSFMVSVSPISR